MTSIKKKIVILGASGQLAHDIIIVLEPHYTLYKINHTDLSIENELEVKKYLTEKKPDIVINTTAFHNVVECEQDPHKSFLINSIALKSLSEVCNKIEAILVHFSTNYVFGSSDKSTPYSENDIPDPVNIYGLSKLSGELIIKAYCAKWYIFRVAGLYGLRGTTAKKYKNFVEMMIELGSNNEVLPSNNEERFTFTSTEAIALILPEILKLDNYGLYHLTNEGDCTRYEFTKEIFRVKNINCELQAVDSKFFKPKFKQPKYTVLENSNLQKIELKMPHWKISLKKYLDKRIEQESNS